MIPKAEIMYNRVPPGKLKDYWKDRINKMTIHREQARKNLFDYRKDKDNFEKQFTKNKCTYCDDFIEDTDLIIDKGKKYHTWCKSNG